MYNIKESKMTNTDGMRLCATVVNRLEMPTNIEYYKDLANVIILQAVEDYRKWTKEYSGSRDDRKLRYSRS